MGTVTSTLAQNSGTIPIGSVLTTVSSVCDAGKSAIGGGWQITSGTPAVPLTQLAAVPFVSGANGSTVDAYKVMLLNPNLTPVTVAVTAVCS